MKYDPGFILHRPILSGECRETLRGLAENYTLAQFMASGRNFEEMTVDFVYTSAKIEGNTYDRIDTDNLLRLGVTAGGKRYTDAVMLNNLRDGFELAMNPGSEALDFDYLCDMHKVLMKDLLLPSEQGLGRSGTVRIGATSYRPLDDPARLREETRFIMSEADQYDDVFERAIYLHCNLAYLQFFKDGNKRAARMMQTAALVRGGVLPLFFSDQLIDRYVRATVNYYETGNYAPYASFFLDNYRMSIGDFLGRAPTAKPFQP